MFEPAVDKVCVGGNVIELTFVWRSQGVPFAAFKSACPRFGKNYKSQLPHVSDVLLFGAKTPYCESRIGPNICWRYIRSSPKVCIGLLPRVFDEDAAIAPRKQHGPSEAKSDGGCAQTWKFFDAVRSGDEQQRDQRQEVARKRSVDCEQADGVKREGKKCDQQGGRRSPRVDVSRGARAPPSLEYTRTFNRRENENGDAEGANRDAKIGNDVLPFLVFESSDLVLLRAKQNHADGFAIEGEALRGEEDRCGDEQQKNGL